jgi:hypothetical protein
MRQYCIVDCHKVVIFDLMPRKYDHIIVDQLPPNAVRVSAYAKQRNCSTSLIYHELLRNVAKFYIVQFQGINFVVEY